MAIPKSVMRAVVRYAVRPTLDPRVPAHRQRRRLDTLGRLARLPRHVRQDQVVLGSRPATRITPQGADPKRAVLYLHGGGYTVGSQTTHRALAAHLASAANVPVYLLGYRLAPEHPYPAALEDAVAAYEVLLETGIPAERLSIAGDSAGGGLAVAALGRIRGNGLPSPGAMALISPWLDLTLTEVRDTRHDPMLSVAWLRGCAASYTGTTPHDDAEVSPLFGDLAGLPPTVVHATTDEILLDDAERFVAAARAAGAPIYYRRLPDLWHVAHLHAGLMTEATEAVQELGEFLQHTGLKRDERVLQ
jgi:epsilon-lactone hydrolase